MSKGDDILGAEVDLTILKGRNLVAKDGSGFLKLGKASTSDPYIKVTMTGAKSDAPLGTTEVVSKNLNPEWNQNFNFHFLGKQFRPKESLVLTIYDRDRGSADDPMGQVVLKMSDLLHGKVQEDWLPVQPCPGCSKVSGDVLLKVSVALRKALSLKQRESLTIPRGTSVVACGLGWDVLKGGKAIDLDTSCVAISFKGEVLMGECVYFANLQSQSGAIRHTGDEREGDEDLGQGDDEIITVDLQRVPPSVCALFFIATVASEGYSFKDVKSARIRLVDWASGAETARFYPGMSGAHTALFLARIARPSPNAEWALQAMGDFDHTARDWGTLIPECKLYLSDLVRGIKADPSERVAVMRKGGVIRISDYLNGGAAAVPSQLVMGLAWDVTRGVNIDLDASAILLDASLQQIDLVFFGKLGSSDGSIKHGGDEREGDEKGDDEKIFLDLRRVHPAVKYIGFVVNSYSGQELDDVKDASCHLYDGASYRDLATFRMTDTKFLDKHTALVMGMLFRDAAGEWGFEIISEAAQGRTAHENVDELQRFIQKRNPQQRVLADPRLPPGAGQSLLSRATTGASQVSSGVGQLVRTMSGRLLGGGAQPQQPQPPVPLV